MKNLVLHPTNGLAACVIRASTGKGQNTFCHHHPTYPQKKESEHGCSASVTHPPSRAAVEKRKRTAENSHFFLGALEATEDILLNGGILRIPEL